VINIPKANIKFTGRIKGEPAHHNKHDIKLHNKACARQNLRIGERTPHGGK